MHTITYHVKKNDVIKGAPDPVARKFIEVCFALERFCKNQLIVCHNRTVSTKIKIRVRKLTLLWPF